MFHDIYRTPYLIQGAVQAILGAQTRSSVLDAEDAEGADHTARGAATDRGPDGSKRLPTLPGEQRILDTLGMVLASFVGWRGR